MSLSIVMPCYNEEAIIAKVIKTYYADIIDKIDDSEFIIINDCSKDSTPQILKGLADELPKLKVLNTPVNSGHGKAMRLGYDSATKEYVFQVDSDDQFESKDFWRLYTLKDGYKFVVGMRKVRNDPFHRKILTRIIRLSNFLLFGTWIEDANCPFRLIKTDVLKNLLNDIDKEALAPNIMISILAEREKIKTASVPITHYARKAGVISIRHWKLIKFSWKGLMQLIALRLKKG
ncbi:glycosyltransferase family 2 protein [Thermoproteota archaeon]